MEPATNGFQVAASVAMEKNFSGFPAKTKSLDLTAYIHPTPHNQETAAIIVTQQGGAIAGLPRGLIVLSPLCRLLPYGLPKLPLDNLITTVPLYH